MTSRKGDQDGRFAGGFPTWGMSTSLFGQADNFMLPPCCNPIIQGTAIN